MKEFFQTSVQLVFKFKALLRSKSAQTTYIGFDFRDAGSTLTAGTKKGDLMETHGLQYSVYDDGR